MSNLKDQLDFEIRQVFRRMKTQTDKRSACPDDEVLAAYCQGNLSQKERERIEEHLTNCDRCTETLILYSEIKSSDDSTDESFPISEMVTQAKGLVRQPDKPHWWKAIVSYFSGLRPAPAIALASVVMAVLVFGIYYQYTPYLPSARINVIARMPSGMPVRGKTTDYKDVEIKNGGVLHSGDRFRITLNLDKKAYVYLLSLDSFGRLAIIFPQKDAQPHIKLESHKTYTIPEDEKWFRLDNNPGHERFFFLSSTKPIENIDNRIAQLQTPGIDKIDQMFPNIKIQSFSFKHEE